MGQVFQHGQRIGDNLMTFYAVKVGDKTNATGIVFKSRVVETTLNGIAGAGLRHHNPFGLMSGLLQMSSHVGNS
jgi:hypothetical protein